MLTTADQDAPLLQRLCEGCRQPKLLRELGKEKRLCQKCRRRGWFPREYLEKDGTPLAACEVFTWQWPLTRHQRRVARRLLGNRCGVCEKEGKLVTDHDHVTGRVRGLLCGPCNAGLGFFGDGPGQLRKALAYVLHPPAEPYWPRR